MKKFMVLYHAPSNVVQQTLLHNRDDSEKGMQAWIIWAQHCGKKLVDLGWPLKDGQELTPTGEITKSQKNVTGYSILQAENIEDAQALLKNHPHLAWNPACTIEVHETIPLPVI